MTDIMVDLNLTSQISA